MKKWKVNNPIEIFKTIVKESKKIKEENTEISELEARIFAFEELKDKKIN